MLSKRKVQAAVKLINSVCLHKSVQHLAKVRTVNSYSWSYIFYFRLKGLNDVQLHQQSVYFHPCKHNDGGQQKPQQKDDNSTQRAVESRVMGKMIDIELKNHSEDDPDKGCKNSAGKGAAQTDSLGRNKDIERQYQ